MRTYGPILLTLVLLLGVAACADPTAPAEGSDASPPVAADPFQGALACVPCAAGEACGDGRLQALRAAPWPGGGVQVTLATDADAPPAVWLEGLPDAALAPAPQTAGVTAVLLVPSADETAHATRRAAAAALVQALPPGEQVAGWAAEGGYPLLADLSLRREHLLDRIAAVPPADAPDPSAGTLHALLARLAAVERDWGPVARELVVIGAAPPPEWEEAPPFAPVRTRWLPVDAVPEGAAAAARALAGTIATDRARLWRLGACLAAPETPLVLVGGGRCTLAAPEPIERLRAVECVPAEAAADAFPYGDEVQLSFTPEQRALFEAAASERSREDFALAVAVGPGAPEPAEAHFRGSSSMGCERKNYSVDLAGGAARRLLPGAASDELYLISMCLDDHYIEQVFADRLLAGLDLFPLEFRYVRVRVDGRNRGAYLLMEKPEEALRGGHLALATVIRRRYDVTGHDEGLKYPAEDGGAAAARAHERYDELLALAEQTPPEELLAVLSARMDLDAYLRWMAVNTFLRNGDYVDEAWFHASPDGVTEDAPWYFRHVGWDPDDLFSACHGDGQHAIDDPHGILYCAEALIDRVLMASPPVYERFVAHLEDLLDRALPPAVLRATMDDVTADLLPLLDDETAAALVELVAQDPAAATAAGARAEIEAHAATLLALAEQRRAELRAAIARYREAR